MAVWEYTVLHCEVTDIGDAIKRKDKRGNLDPGISDQDWMRMTFKVGRQDVCRVIKAPGGFYTTLSRGLNQWGSEGWELAGASPTLELWTGGQNPSWQTTTFYLFLKKRSE